MNERPMTCGLEADAPPTADPRIAALDQEVVSLKQKLDTVTAERDAITNKLTAYRMRVFGDALKALQEEHGIDLQVPTPTQVQFVPRPQ